MSAWSAANRRTAALTATALWQPKIVRMSSGRAAAHTDVNDRQARIVAVMTTLNLDEWPAVGPARTRAACEVSVQIADLA